jgi:hypothetical protein
VFVEQLDEPLPDGPGSAKDADWNFGGHGDSEIKILALGRSTQHSAPTQFHEGNENL